MIKLEATNIQYKYPDVFFFCANKTAVKNSNDFKKYSAVLGRTPNECIKKVRFAVTAVIIEEIKKIIIAQPSLNRTLSCFFFICILFLKMQYKSNKNWTYSYITACPINYEIF